MSSPIDKELNIVKMVAEMAQKKYSEKLTPKTLDVIKNKSGIIISTIDINSLKKLRKNFPCLEHKKL